MEELYAYRADLIAALDAVVDQLAKIMAILPTRQWNLSINPVGHTPHYILFHLHVLEAQFFAAQLPRILAEETPTLPVFEDERWMADTYRLAEPPSAILGEFGELRHRELAWLRNLPPAGWSRLARHPWWGLHAMQWWVELQADYSDQHVKQLSSVLEL
jgi:hypothetical protein